jgi:type I restriction enzyme S subunit
MVPEGWEATQLGDCATFQSGSTPSKERPDFWGAGIPWVSAKDLKQHFISFAQDELTPLGASHAKMAKPHSILMLVRGMTLMKDIPIGYVVKPVAFNQDIKALVAKLGVDPLYLSYLLVGRKLEIMGLVNTANHGTGRLDTELVKGLPFNLPPLPEQQKIAEVLGVWDRAIATTTALLANARAQKRALMQSLITGHRRFPGFEAKPWHEVRLGDVTEVIVSNIDKKSDESERPVRLCNYTDVYKNDTIIRTMPFMEATATAGQIERFGLKVGDVIITKDSETPDDIAVPAYVAETADDLVCGYHLAIIRPGPMADGRYFKFLFELPHTKYYFGTRANGATRFGLTIDGIKDAVFQLPSLAEQHTIANVLNDAEAEISSHMKTLDRLRTEKKALMQQLLTGQRRVVV